ncbi:50S rRNA methyltransferase [Planococcus maritimus]|uniref:class I SAM-dependent rRNA methyltransferase n=1 Tax=Planococcus maritimus TaxID=192421 RepID=UPI00084BD6C0|nr:class I SAM-dependent rRNA methyltransferase [Planococcus maritimus]OED31576.1 50S rRNA methyltransferase [Planococcus maritimus]
MRNELTVTVKDTLRNELAKGSPLVTKDGLMNDIDASEGSLLRLVDKDGEYLGTGYYGEQNKGAGWVLTRNQDEAVGQAFIERKLELAFSRREKFFNNPNTTAFRVFNGEGDGFGGLTIDYYAGFYLLSWYSEGVYSFREDVVAALENVVECIGIYEKKRFDTKGQYIEDDDFVSGERGEFPLIVQENGVNYAVYLNDGAMTGIFLDQRDVRQAIRTKYADGKTVLNTFSYTGAFSVAAALGGADKTTSVDLAKRSSAKTIEQFSINGIDFDEQDILVMDVFNYFKYAKRKNLSFDVVVLDPPSFARSKKHVFSAAKDYTNLMKESIDITEPGGLIVASTNSASFNMKKFTQMIDKAFKDRDQKYKVVETYSLPADFHVDRRFPEGDYLKVLFLRLL